MVVAGLVVVLMGFGVNAFAQMGRGAGMGAGRSNLTDDQIQQMQAEQNAFQTATEDIRLQINEKRQALHTEMGKQTPDAAIAEALQKEISDLQSQFARSA